MDGSRIALNTTHSLLTKLLKKLVLNDLESLLVMKKNQYSSRALVGWIDL